ncbi:uncharacterized protein LOC142597951 [Dermatophagoides farinae]|uniref:uncharacterized protein LOC142597951 n=1 Tax=Dermatophagoides farinae TaxID=6954 RepID=UPI003F5F6A33
MVRALLEKILEANSLDQIRKSSSENICITPFERNLNFWEQLWRTVEFSDVLLIIIDARSPLLFFNILFYNYVQELGKQPIVLLNKSDKEMCSEGSYNNQSDYVSNWVGNANLLESSTVAVGLVGFPNVGKSTVINSIIRPRLNKNVKVSSTPGKTKFLQTFMLLENGITLIDSPGLIFPIAAKSKADLVINGILNINTCDSL